jgi:hypothetical protein
MKILTISAQHMTLDHIRRAVRNMPFGATDQQIWNNYRPIVAMIGRLRVKKTTAYKYIEKGMIALMLKSKSWIVRLQAKHVVQKYGNTDASQGALLTYKKLHRI